MKWISSYPTPLGQAEGVVRDVGRWWRHAPPCVWGVASGVKKTLRQCLSRHTFPLHGGHRPVRGAPRLPPAPLARSPRQFPAGDPSPLEGQAAGGVDDRVVVGGAHPDGILDHAESAAGGGGRGGWDGAAAVDGGRIEARAGGGVARAGPELELDHVVVVEGAGAEHGALGVVETADAAEEAEARRAVATGSGGSGLEVVELRHVARVGRSGRQRRHALRAAEVVDAAERLGLAVGRVGRELIVAPVHRSLAQGRAEERRVVLGRRQVRLLLAAGGGAKHLEASRRGSPIRVAVGRDAGQVEGRRVLVLRVAAGVAVVHQRRRRGPVAGQQRRCRLGSHSASQVEVQVAAGRQAGRALATGGEREGQAVRRPNAAQAALGMQRLQGRQGAVLLGPLSVQRVGSPPPDAAARLSLP